jgi:hypothetical protein
MAGESIFNPFPILGSGIQEGEGCANRIRGKILEEAEQKQTGDFGQGADKSFERVTDSNKEVLVDASDSAGSHLIHDLVETFLVSQCVCKCLRTRGHCSRPGKRSDHVLMCSLMKNLEPSIQPCYQLPLGHGNS